MIRNFIKKGDTMNYNEQNDYDNIYSHSFEDISSNSNTQKIRPKKKKKKRFLKVFLILICIFLTFVIGFTAYAYSILSNITTVPLDTDNLNIETSNYDGVKNIALFGIDSRADDKVGRSDANVIITIDKKHGKIKLTSIARDSYVAIDGKGNDKLTHAYAYGRSELMVKTLNKNFGLEITDYLTMNFFELARVIDYLGGIEVDVDEAEFQELNSYVIPTTDFGDLPCEYLKAPGFQNLSGTQAVCYARIRHTDGDIERGNRQKEVLNAIFVKVKGLSIFKLPKFASMFLSECETSLSTNEIMGIGIRVLLYGTDFEELSIPNDNVKASGKTIGGKWCYVYDLNKAKEEINNFILETKNTSE